MSDLHKDPWVMQRIALALNTIRDADYDGRETELDLLAFAEDVLDHINNDIWLANKRASALAGVIERAEEHLRSQLDYKPDGPSPSLEAMAVILRRQARDAEERVWQEAWDFHEDMHAMPVEYVSYQAHKEATHALVEDD